MADKKSKKTVAKSKSSGLAKKSTKSSSKSNIRVQRNEAKVKVKSTVKAYKGALSTVSVLADSVVTRFGIISSMDSSSISFLTKPKSGSSKEGVMLIDRDNVIAVEGTVGGKAKIVVTEKTEVALFKDVSVSIKDGAYILKEPDGAEIHIQKRPGVTVNVISFLK